LCGVGAWTFTALEINTDSNCAELFLLEDFAFHYKPKCNNESKYVKSSYEKPEAEKSCSLPTLFQIRAKVFSVFAMNSSPLFGGSEP
jgi:hypothetical protein